MVRSTLVGKYLYGIPLLLWKCPVIEGQYLIGYMDYLETDSLTGNVKKLGLLHVERVD